MNHPFRAMECEVCASSVSIFTRKKCSQCQRIHCSKCSKRTAPTSLAKICVLCHRLMSLAFTRQDLDQYTVKELRHFLIRNNRCTDNFKEKADLIEAVMKLSSTSYQASDDIEHVRHVEQLKERMMKENSNSQAAPPSPSCQSPGNHSSESNLPASPVISSQGNENIPLPPLNDDSSPGALPSEVETSSTGAAVSANSTASSVLPEPPEVTPVAMPTPVPDAVTGTPHKRMTLNQLSNKEDIEGLSVRQLKELLVTNYVDYKGCCERQELMDRVQRLWLDNQKNKILVSDEPGSSDTDLCKVCMDAVIDCILLECGHMVTCTQCGRRMAECPICRHYVSRVVHVFKA